MVGTMSEKSVASFDTMKADPRIEPKQKLEVLNMLLQEIDKDMVLPGTTDYQKQVAMYFKARISADSEEYEGIIKGGGR